MTSAPRQRAVVGAGRMGRALVAALQADGPLGRGADAAAADVVLLAVPDAEIASAAACIAHGPFVGHLSGATTLAPLAGHRAFSLHPLMTFPGRFEAAGAAIAGDSPESLAVAEALARELGLTPFEIDDADRAAYHAAAAVASNFLVTLEDAAERLLATTGAGRAGRHLLVPLVRQTVENWAQDGAAALTGPIRRGDEETVTRQRAAIAERAPDLLPLFDLMAEQTRELVA